MSLGHDSEKQPVPQGVYWNEEDWQSLLTRLPSDWQEQAIRLGAGQRVRKLACIGDLLRVLLVYIRLVDTPFERWDCGRHWWALGSLSEPSLAQARGAFSSLVTQWCSRLPSARIGLPIGYLPGSGRILLLDGSRLKTPAGTGRRCQDAREL